MPGIFSLCEQIRILALWVPSKGSQFLEVPLGNKLFKHVLKAPRMLSMNHCRQLVGIPKQFSKSEAPAFARVQFVVFFGSAARGLRCSKGGVIGTTTRRRRLTMVDKKIGFACP